jgi:hypothetical protein
VTPAENAFAFASGFHYGPPAAFPSIFIVNKALEILLLIVVPLAWGLLVERLFESARRRRNRSANEGDETVDDGTG